MNNLLLSRVIMMMGPKIWFVISRVRYIQGSLYRENLQGVC